MISLITMYALGVTLFAASRVCAADENHPGAVLIVSHDGAVFTGAGYIACNDGRPATRSSSAVPSTLSFESTKYSVTSPLPSVGKSTVQLAYPPAGTVPLS